MTLATEQKMYALFNVEGLLPPAVVPGFLAWFAATKKQKITGGETRGKKKRVRALRAPGAKNIYPDQSIERGEGEVVAHAFQSGIYLVQGGTLLFGPKVL